MKTRRDYRLVYFQLEWMVCSKALRRDEDGEPRAVWIYGKERLEFCDVGREAYVTRVPDVEDINFQNDRFAFAIDRKFVWQDRWEKCAGSDNIAALHYAFKSFLEQERPNTEVRMRHGGRVVSEGIGQAKR